ncbi:aminotransferase-like domain-containing protein [Fodinicola feengrottensis]|uniref:aminotransferase-like domain-containing protein n=1 Tax=Fodinicola feengrottensis TaxID=435914 RepID=UPI002442D7FB|nr:PLP-dependent aminotransferase family protein [Fodinicola feengrottensis]
MEPIELSERLGRWSTGRGPLYVLLASRLRQMIDDGELPPGTPLPPDRSLAAALAVGRTTVVAAYEQLTQDGRIVRRQGSGTRVAGERRTTALETTAAPMFLHQLEPRDGVILFACAAPDAPPPEVAQAYARIVPELASISNDIGYHPAGHPRLRAAIAERYTQRGNPTTVEEVLVTNGGQQALSLTARGFVRPGERVLLEAPTYPGALEAFREEGAVLRALPVGLTGFAAAVREERPALAYVIPTFHNPTGSVLSAPDRVHLAAVAAATGVPLIADEVPADLGFPGERPPPAMTGEAVIAVGSFEQDTVGWAADRMGAGRRAGDRAADPATGRA